MTTDVRWIQRLNNFAAAMKTLREGIEAATTRTLNNLEKQGLIQAFEYNYELAWNTVKDFYEAQGETNIQGSRDAFMLAFNRGLAQNHGATLIEAIKARQMSSHTYNEATADDIYNGIVKSYYKAFKELLDNLTNEKNKVA
jgi:nucleotidyltransferase substrate binding protein (TIGR01987 family)